MASESPTDVRGEALRLLTNGVYVLTACLGETVHATTVTWVSQVSFQPPLVMVALRRNSHIANALRKSRRFALNILAPEQEGVAKTFFEYLTAPESAGSVAGYSFRPSPAHCPLLMDALGWIEGRVAAEPPTPGDHSLLLGEVTGAGIRRQAAPMVLWNTPWTYGGLSEP